MIDTLDPETTTVGWQAPSDPEAEAAADATARRNAPLEWLKQHPVFHPSNQRAVPIIGLRKLGRRRGQYEMILRGYPNVELGTAEEVLQPKKVQAAIADTTGIVIDELKRPKWREVAAGIFTAAGPGEDIGTDPEAEARGWLAAMIGTVDRKTQTVDMNDQKGLSWRLRAIRGERTPDSIHSPFSPCAGWFLDVRGRMYVNIPALVRFVTGPTYGARTTQQDTRLRLRRLGFLPVQVSARDDAGTVRKARLWVSPQGFDPDE